MTPRIQEETSPRREQRLVRLSRTPAWYLSLFVMNLGNIALYAVAGSKYKPFHPLAAAMIVLCSLLAIGYGIAAWAKIRGANA